MEDIVPKDIRKVCKMYEKWKVLHA
jgi:hypothetical protein